MTGKRSITIGLPRRRGLGWAATIGDALTGLQQLERIYLARPRDLDPAAFVRYAIDGLGLRYEIARGDPSLIPDQGPLLVVANHPLGGPEGLAIADLLLQRRRDLKLLANGLLCKLPELAPLIIPVDVFRAGVNAAALRAATRHLRAGGALLAFPAGEVSRLDWSRREVSDPPWQATAARIAHGGRAKVLPIHVGARAHPLSLAAGIVHPRLRTAMLVRDLVRQRGRPLHLSLGEAIPAPELERVPPDARTAYLRLATYALRPSASTDPAQTLAPLAAETPRDALAASIAALPAQRRLLTQGELELFLAPANEMPLLLEEIARLRELSFRAVGEGCGRARDTDAFDAHYQHLFLWHAPSRQIVGAYRLGFTDRILPRLGVEGLYTHTLFEFDRRLFERIGPAMELGRSFVVPEWQRSFHPLRLLWAGIATILQREPQLRCLFGPVSISPSYSAAARQIMAEALSHHHSDAALRDLIRPRRPQSAQRAPEAQRQVVSALADPQLLSRLIARVEQGPGLPVLLRHYLELNGRFAGFNVDQSFGGTLDGLVFVDVRNIPARILARYTAAGSVAPR